MGLEAEVVALASGGAGTLVGLMVTDLWQQVRDKVATLFAGHGDDAAEVGAALDRSRAELIAARQAEDEVGVADVHSEWRLRLRRLLSSNPAAAQELRALLLEVQEASGPQQQAFVLQNGQAIGSNSTLNQVGSGIQING